MYSIYCFRNIATVWLPALKAAYRLYSISYSVCHKYIPIAKFVNERHGSL